MLNATEATLSGLRLIVGGMEMEPALTAPGGYAFALPANPGEVRLRSPVFRPVELGHSGDPRTLGFAVTSIEIVTHGGRRRFGPGSAAFGEGFHPAESDWRWTTGEAVLPAAMFAGQDRPSLLVLCGFGQPGTQVAHSHHGAFLAGDSWPADEHVEQQVLRVLSPFLEGAIAGQATMLPPDNRGHHERNLAARTARLAATLEGKTGKVVLFGRSSGARVATLHARQAEVAAVVCLSYPFHAPGRMPEPERHAHLATIATPTLIIQGRDDPYGIAADIDGTALSPQVSLHMIDGTHEFLLDEAGWQALGRRILLFLARVG